MYSVKLLHDSGLFNALHVADISVANWGGKAWHGSASHLPDILAALLNAALCPPLRPATNPRFVALVRLHPLHAETELEVVVLVVAVRHAAESVPRFDLGADGWTKLEMQEGRRRGKTDRGKT
jgi:hypothetical protein